MGISGSPVVLTIADTPSSAPASAQRAQDDRHNGIGAPPAPPAARSGGSGDHSSTRTASMTRNRNSVSDKIRCSSWISNPS